MIYTLVATLGNRVQKETFSASDDMEATMNAISIIMDEAYADNRGPWAIGEITLANNDKIIHSMPAKG